MDKRFIELPKEEEELIVKMYCSGVSPANIIPHVSVKSPGPIIRILKKYGVAIRGPKKIKFSSEKTREMIELYNCGTPVSHIAPIFNCNQSTIKRILTEKGVYKNRSGKEIEHKDFSLEASILEEDISFME